jgi:hypothetical protein
MPGPDRRSRNKILTAMEATRNIWLVSHIVLRPGRRAYSHYQHRVEWAFRDAGRFAVILGVQSADRGELYSHPLNKGQHLARHPHTTNAECFDRKFGHLMFYRTSCNLIDNLLTYACFRSAPSFLVRRTNIVVVIAPIQHEGFHSKLHSLMPIWKSLCSPLVSKNLRPGCTG